MYTIGANSPSPLWWEQFGVICTSLTEIYDKAISFPPQFRRNLCTSFHFPQKQILKQLKCQYFPPLVYLSFIYSTNYIWSSFNFTISSIIFRPTSSNGWYYPLSLLLIPAHMSQLQHIETFFFPPLKYCSINNYTKPLIFAQPFHNTC